MNWVQSMTKDRATIVLEFDDVEFIGMEMPRGDGFTKDWWADVWGPMLRLREPGEDDL